MFRLDWFRVLGGGKLCPDHLDLVAEPDRTEEVIAAIGDWFRTPGSRVLDLEGIRANARIISAVEPARISHLDVAIFEPLGATMAEYLSARSKSFNKKVRKFQRQSDVAEIAYRRVPFDEVAVAMDEFAAMHAVRPDRKELVAQIPRIRQAVLLGAARDEVRIHVAERDGRCGAVQILFATGGRMNVYQTARAQDAEFNHVGSVLNLWTIAGACDEGLSEIDFLRGPERYKYSFAAHERSLMQVRAAHGVFGHTALLLLVSLLKVRSWLAVLRHKWRR